MEMRRPGCFRWFLLHSDAKEEVCNLLGARAAAPAPGPCLLLHLAVGKMGFVTSGWGEARRARGQWGSPRAHFICFSASARRWGGTYSHPLLIVPFRRLHKCNLIFELLRGHCCLVLFVRGISWWCDRSVGRSWAVAGRSNS